MKYFEKKKKKKEVFLIIISAVTSTATKCGPGYDSEEK